MANAQELQKRMQEALKNAQANQKVNTGTFDWVGNSGGKAGVHVLDLSKTDIKVGDSIDLLITKYHN